MSEEFAGTVALVTGARAGIGLATAELLAARGARVLLGGRDADRLAPVVERLRRQGRDVEPFVADVTRPAQLQAAFAAAATLGDVPRLLVNNVGARDRRGVDDLDTAAFSRLVDADLVSAYDVIQRFLATHDGDAGGVIVNVSSLAAVRGRAGDVGYAAAKAGLEGMTRSLAAELGPRGYRVNAVAPGMVGTAVNDPLRTDPRFIQLIGERTPLGRWGEPSEIAEAICFLASPRASYITGQSLLVDGGFSNLF